MIEPRDIFLTLSTGPVRLKDNEWPVTASMTSRHGGEFRVLSVREHDDGRAIVYGLVDCENGDGKADGELLTVGVSDESISAALSTVGARLGHSKMFVARVQQQILAVDLL